MSRTQNTIIAARDDVYLFHAVDGDFFLYKSADKTFLRVADVRQVFDYNWDFKPTVANKVRKSIEEFAPVVRDFDTIRERISAARELIQKYSPDQPRDSHGRFGEGDGGGDKDKPQTITFRGEPISKGRDSLWNHLVPDGKGGFQLSPERQALHDKLVKEFLDQAKPAVGTPTAYLLGGGPAAGKSTATNDPALGIPNTDPKNGDVNAVLVNPDKFKEELPEYQKMVDAKDMEAASFAHEESSMLAKELYAAALADGTKNVLLDGTGDSSAQNMLGKIAAAEACGYQTQGIYVTCPTDMAVERAGVRAEHSGRAVPEEYIRGVHSTISTIVPQIASSFDSFRLIDTTNAQPGDPATVIAQATKGSDLQVLNQDAYNAFLAKAGK